MIGHAENYEVGMEIDLLDKFCEWCGGKSLKVVAMDGWIHMTLLCIKCGSYIIWNFTREDGDGFPEFLDEKPEWVPDQTETLSELVRRDIVEDAEDGFQDWLGEVFLAEHV